MQPPLKFLIAFATFFIGGQCALVAAPACRLGEPVVHQSTNSVTEPLFTRRFKIDPNELTSSIDVAAPNDPTSLFDPFPVPLNSPGEVIRTMVREAGVNIGNNPASPGVSNPGQAKTLFYNERTGTLLVRATMPELQLIQEALQQFDYPSPLIRIEILLIYEDGSELPPELLWNLMPQTIRQLPEGKATHTVFHPLTGEEMAKLTLRLKETASIKVIQLPVSVTVSGRQSRTSPMEISTRRKPVDPSTDPLGFDDVLVHREFPGYMVDVLPKVEGKTGEIDLMVVLTLNEAMNEILNGINSTLPTMHQANATLRNGSSLIMIPVIPNSKPSPQVYLITPIIIDQDGKPLGKDHVCQRKISPN